MSDKKPTDRSDDGGHDGRENDPDYDLSDEKLVAPEENISWLPEPEPSDGDAPAP